MKMRTISATCTILIAAVIFSLSCMAWGASMGSTSGVMSESEALNTAQKWALALGRADIAGLDELLHDDYMHIHATSMVESKATFIGALKEGARKYAPFTIEDFKVRVFGDTAVVTGKFTLKATMRERVIERVNRFGLVVVNTPLGVKVASFQATSIPETK
jgi:ketosteroid isomerase-like protein